MTEFIQVPPDCSGGKKVHAKKHNDGVNDIFTPVNHLCDPDTPENMQSVDNEGQAYTRFAEGSPSFDVFGRTTMSESDLVDVFKFYQSDYADQFEKKVVGTANAAFDSSFAGLKLTTSTDSGDSITYTSHRYHHYRPGNGMPLIFTMKVGDANKANLVRRVGMFDDHNGVFFEIAGSDMSVVVRSSLGQPENKIIRDNWNGDRLDGTGGVNNKSEAELDTTKNNIWWIDFQYLGAGAVRFGTYVNGKKYVCHTIGHYNELDRQYMSTASLPFRVEQFNDDIVSADSSMHVFCVVLLNDGYSEVCREPYSIKNTKEITSTDFKPIISFKPAQLNENGVDNRARILPRLLSLLSTDAPVEFKLSIGSILTGDTFAESIVNCVYDTAAIDITGGRDLGGSFLGSGMSESIDMTNNFEITRDGIWRKADITQSDFITISARLLSAGSSTVGVVCNLLEVT